MLTWKSTVGSILKAVSWVEVSGGEGRVTYALDI